MNKRMREPFHTLMWKASIGYNDSWSQVDPEVLEKFAEMILERVIDIVGDGGEFASRPKLIEKIKNEFGIDE